MKSKLMLIAVPVLFGASGALAAEGEDAKGEDAMQVSGSIGLDFLWTSTGSDTLDAAKLNEYRDLSSGISGHFDLKGRSSEYYFDAFGENLGRDDLYLDLKGGKYGKFKYQLYENKIIHNWAFDARTPYTGIGTDTLTTTFPQTNPNTWNLFDFGMQRDDVGGMFELSNDSPWYFRVDANQVTDTGLKVIGGSNGTSPGNGFTEKPAPVDYKTQNVSVEGGYASKTSQLSVNALYSKFTNENDLLRWTNGYFGNQLDASTLPVDNDYIRLGVSGALKQLPLGSTLAGRVTYSTTLSNVPIQATALNTGGVYNSTNPSVPAFDGEVVHTTASLSLFSNPLKWFDFRAYANYFEKENNSTHIDFTALATGLTCGRIVLGATVLDPGDCATETLNYRKSNFGADLGFRITQNNRLVWGLDYTDLRRDRVDYSETEDYKGTIEYRNTSFDFVSMRLKYQALARRSNFLEGDAAAGDPYGASNNPEYLNRYIARFDAANMDQNLVKLVLDFNPVNLLDVSLEAIYKENDYADTVLGRTKDNRHQAYFSIAYGDIRKFRVMLFGDVEHVERDSYHRAIGTVSSGAGAAPNDLPSGYCQSTAPGCYDPYGAPFGTPSSNYNWGATTHDRNWAVGIGADWVVVPRIKLSASIVGAVTDGNEDITPQPGANPSQQAVPINSYDDAKSLALNLKGTFQVGKAWEIVGGYSYERFRFADISYDGYQYIAPGSTAAQNSYLTGIYAFPEYTAHIVYMTTTFRF